MIITETKTGILIPYYRNNLVKIIVGFKKYRVKIIAGKNVSRPNSAH